MSKEAEDVRRLHQERNAVYRAMLLTETPREHEAAKARLLVVDAQWRAAIARLAGRPFRESP